MSSTLLRASLRSFCSGVSFLSSTPARSASSCRAPRLSVFSISSTNVNTSPDRSQPKQYHDCICGLTLKLGLSSEWNGHRPHRSLFRRVRRTCSWTTFTRSTFALTSAKASSDPWGGTDVLCGAPGHGARPAVRPPSASLRAFELHPGALRQQLKGTPLVGLLD